MQPVGHVIISPTLGRLSCCSNLGVALSDSSPGHFYILIWKRSKRDFYYPSPSLIDMFLCLCAVLTFILYPTSIYCTAPAKPRFSAHLPFTFVHTQPPVFHHNLLLMTQIGSGHHCILDTISPWGEVGSVLNSIITSFGLLFPLGFLKELFISKLYSYYRSIRYFSFCRCRCRSEKPFQVLWDRVFIVIYSLQVLLPATLLPCSSWPGPPDGDELSINHQSHPQPHFDFFTARHAALRSS